MKRYFASPESELCYPLNNHIQDAQEAGLTEIELYEAEKTTMSGIFFCREYSAVTEVGECGKQCKHYAPRNGIKGMCKYRSNTLYLLGEKVKIKVK